MIIKRFILLLFGAGLIACSDVYEITVQAEQLEITESAGESDDVNQLISPYKAKLEAQMDLVIAHATNDFVKGRPHGALNNWSADAIYQRQLILNKSIAAGAPVICLLNVGGLRNPLSAGEITVGDIFKLMPFDNEIVWVELPIASAKNIVEYLKRSGGEPIAGATVEKDALLFEDAATNPQTFWVITSDYLMNGGDKMTFFEDKLSSKLTGVLMRDEMLMQASSQDTLVFDNKPRIMF